MGLLVFGFGGLGFGVWGFGSFWGLGVWEFGVWGFGGFENVYIPCPHLQEKCSSFFKLL